MGTIIAILEDDERRRSAMQELLSQNFRRFKFKFFDNAPDMIEWLSQHLSETALIALDHDLGPNQTRFGETFDPGTGRDVVNYLAAQEPVCPVIIHTTNTMAAAGMEATLSDSGWGFKRVIPFDDLNWINKDWGSQLKRALNRPNL